MELIELATKGTPFLLLGLLIAVVRLIDHVKTLSKDVQSIKDNITWGDTCNERHEVINRRLSILEQEIVQKGKKGLG